MTDSSDFYQTTNVIENFADVVQSEVYTPLPDDWFIIVTDLKASTKAIEVGRYKEVNMAGASIISALSNHFKGTDIPFMFGGDGATVAIPPTDPDKVKDILLSCQMAVRGAFDLHLDTGLFRMDEIRKQGYDIRVARLKLSDLITQTLFWGEGIEFVEKQIKEQSTSRVQRTPKTKADFSGLECRWNTFPGKKDEVLSVIIRSRSKDEKDQSTLYKESIQKIEQIFGTEQEIKPVSVDQLRLTGNPRYLSTELKLRIQPKPTWKDKMLYWLELFYRQVAGVIVMKYKIETDNTNWGDYKPDFVRHADFRKFNNTLRMVISATATERKELEQYLETLYKQGKLYYGLHSSAGAITTCFVTDYQGYHIHFIDGSEGGYANAAKSMKEQQSV